MTPRLRSRTNTPSTTSSRTRTASRPSINVPTTAHSSSHSATSATSHRTSISPSSLTTDEDTIVLRTDQDRNETVEDLENLELSPVKDTNRALFDTTMREAQQEGESFLEQCKEKQKKAQPTIGPQHCGTWVISESALHHECYNVHLFQTLEKLEPPQQRHNAKVVGKGTIALRVSETTHTAQTIELVFKNVKYVETSEVEAYHIIAKGALPAYQFFYYSQVPSPVQQFMGCLFDNSTFVMACIVSEHLQGAAGLMKILKLMTHNRVEVIEVVEEEENPNSKKRKLGLFGLSG